MRGGALLWPQVGALHALETLAQLVVQMELSEPLGQQQPRLSGRPRLWLMAGNVSDWPRFTHRWVTSWPSLQMPFICHA